MLNVKFLFAYKIIYSYVTKAIVLRKDYCDARPFCSALLKIGYLF